MPEEKTPVAGQEKPQTGPRTTKRTAGTTININTMDTGKPRQPEPKTEQHTDTAPAPAAPGPEEAPKPPVFTKPITYSHTNREAVYASPLAATLFARFDPNYTGVQPCEFAVFEDIRLKQRGFI